MALDVEHAERRPTRRDRAAFGEPDPALFPAAGLADACREALADGGGEALPYGANAGPAALRRTPRRAPQRARSAHDRRRRDPDQRRRLAGPRSARHAVLPAGRRGARRAAHLQPRARHPARSPRRPSRRCPSITGRPRRGRARAAPRRGARHGPHRAAAVHDPHLSQSDRDLRCRPSAGGVWSRSPPPTACSWSKTTSTASSGTAARRRPHCGASRRPAPCCVWARLPRRSLRGCGSAG